MHLFPNMPYILCALYNCTASTCFRNLTRLSYSFLSISSPPFLFFIPSPLKVRKALACLLSAIDQQLNKAGVRYVISSGTLLGAVRSSRFIPWDDDLDFRIHDDDFEKFQTCVSIKKLISTCDCGVINHRHDISPTFMWHIRPPLQRLLLPCTSLHAVLPFVLVVGFIFRKEKYYKTFSISSLFCSLLNLNGRFPSI